MIPVRATINLPGLPRGSEAMVDETDRYMADALEAGYLVRIPPADRAPDIPPDGDPVDDVPQDDDAAPPVGPAAEEIPAPEPPEARPEELPVEDAPAEPVQPELDAADPLGG